MWRSHEGDDPATPGTPGYLSLSEERFAERVEGLFERYADCDLCAHECGVDRTAGETGVCRVGETPVVSGAAPHHGEEEPIRGTNGSGTIFLANCNMGCVFCQNAETSHGGQGEPASAAGIAEMALELQSRGCHNVNLVSPTHHAPHLIEAVRLAREEGLAIPIVWNCGGYERPEVLAELEGIVDVYMPDVKWGEDAAATRYSKTPGYWTNVRESLAEMHRQVGDLRIEDGVATRGLLVRHLVMPGQVDGARRLLDFLAEELSAETYVNLMAQYRPHHLAREDRYAEIGRPITGEEYRAVVDHAREVGLRRLAVDERALAGRA